MIQDLLSRARKPVAFTYLTRRPRTTYESIPYYKIAWTELERILYIYSAANGQALGLTTEPISNHGRLNCSLVLSTSPAKISKNLGPKRSLKSWEPNIRYLGEAAEAASATTPMAEAFRELNVACHKQVLAKMIRLSVGAFR